MASPESDIEREAKAVKLAYEEGRRSAHVDSRLGDHDRQLAVLNGNIRRGAEANENTRKAVDELRERIDDLIEAMRIRDAVTDTTERVLRDNAIQTQKAAESAVEKESTHKHLVIAIIGLVFIALGFAVALLGVLVSNKII